MKEIDFETGEIISATRKITVEDSVTFHGHPGIPNGKFVMVYKESLRAFLEECKKGKLHQSESTLLIYCLCNMNEKNEVQLHYRESKEKLGLGPTSFSAARKNLEKMKILTQKESGQGYIVNFATLKVNGRFASTKEMMWHDFARCPALCSSAGKILQIGIEPKLQKIALENEKHRRLSEKMRAFGEDLSSLSEDVP